MTGLKKATALALAAAALLSLSAGCGMGEDAPLPTAAPEPVPGTLPEPAEAETAEGRQLSLYWRQPEGGSYDDCDIWIWWEGKGGEGYPFRECEYGGKVVVNVPESVEEVGFIVRRDCSEPGGSTWGSATKDYESDRFVTLEGAETSVYLLSGDGGLYKSKDGGKTLEMTKKISFASMADVNSIRYSLSSGLLIENMGDVRVYEGEREIAVTALSSLGKESAGGYVETAESLDLSGSYRLEIRGCGEKTVVPMDIFDTEYFAENFHYEGEDLGAHTEKGSTLFKLWAPTAGRVVLKLFETGHGGEAYKRVDMTRGEKGVWEHREDCGHGCYYSYEVTTAPGTQEAVDPYAKAVGVNGDRGMVVDLSLTDPEGWEEAELAEKPSAYSEAVIWEVHVRDFSNKIEGSEYKGKYLAFTETGLRNEYGEAVGVDYLKELGITHVHLLPVYDYATVDERDPEAPFNWGYDPKNYNAPEGSYSTDPFKGEVRIREFKEMVAALHAAGIGVITDMVYNHTYDANSSLNRIVPYYYYRYTPSGANTSASGCGNDTASERYMFGKFMVESAAYWVEEYKLDGLRFDLMGLHDLETMQELETAVHAVNPHAIIYGEGWTMGAAMDGSAQANQGNISRIRADGDAIGAIAVFNDVIRDGLKGSVFDKASRGYISGRSGGNTGKVIFGLRGGSGMGQGWRVEDAMVINYMSAHDNNTLWDKLELSNGSDSEEKRCRMNRLGAAVIMLAKGTPFWQAGEEMLRTKGGDENSYRSSDEVNNIDWSVLHRGSAEYETMCYYRGLIEMRKGFGIFTAPEAEIVMAEELGCGVLAVRWADGKGGEAVALINPHDTALPVTLPEGEWALVADAFGAGAAALRRDSGSVTVEAIGVRVYVNGALAG